jgi:hypothetical protein
MWTTVGIYDLTEQNGVFMIVNKFTLQSAMVPQSIMSSVRTKSTSS